MSATLESQLKLQGYTDLKQVPKRGLCALLPMAYTTALVYGIDKYGYAGRYCYEHRADVEAAFKDWDGTSHPSGPWIKLKGLGMDLLNPELTA